MLGKLFSIRFKVILFRNYFFYAAIAYLLKDKFIIKKKFDPELLKTADKNILDQVIQIIAEMAKKDKSIEEMLHKHHLKLS